MRCSHLTVSDKGALAECLVCLMIELKLMLYLIDITVKYSKENLLKQITYLYNAKSILNILKSIFQIFHI